MAFENIANIYLCREIFLCMNSFAWCACLCMCVSSIRIFILIFACHFFFSDRMEIINDTPEMDGIKEARPIQIVTTENDHTFILDEDTLTEVLLQDHIKDRFVVVVSVAGAFRKGKSFLLDFFLRYLYARVSWMVFISSTNTLISPNTSDLMVNFVNFCLVWDKRCHWLDREGGWTVTWVFMARRIGTWYNRYFNVVRHFYVGF